MNLSVFDLFKIGLGPSSSHTVGPMRAALRFVTDLEEEVLRSALGIRVDLYGSLALTGRGHATDKAVILGLSGLSPETVDPDHVEPTLIAIRQCGLILLPGRREVSFNEADDIVLHRRERLPFHTNGMRFSLTAIDGTVIKTQVFYSIGGGFILSESEASEGAVAQESDVSVRYPFGSAADLLSIAGDHKLSISAIMLANEETWRTQNDTREGLLRIWGAMKSCAERGFSTEGRLPGGLNVERRAPAMRRKLLASETSRSHKLAEGFPPVGEHLEISDWIAAVALAVNEENAAGGRVVTAPTNGAAGIVPAVLYYYYRFVPRADHDGIVRFLLTAGAVGFLFKKNASISGAEVGCQGEVGVACSMAAAGLAEVMGGSPAQVENAAEIGMEHNLGLTCDPIAGLVQVPCIERNALAANKAISAARLALYGDGSHHVSLDKVIRTMRITGADMKRKYKETSLGGLAVNVPVSLPDC